MSFQGREYQSIFSYLRSLNFHFLDSWVVECVNYYKSNNPNISLEQLKSEVKQQWLLVNLREIKVPSLPADLKSQTKVILNGSYAVQVESMIDSSKSCYSQFKKLLKIDVEDAEPKKEFQRNTKFNRCLTFVMTDGVQEVEGMEYEPIRKIKTTNSGLLPGFKMVIVGPVECRRGMFLLKDENVVICGGEVDVLTVSNSLKNILMKKLELDENDYPDLCEKANEPNDVQITNDVQISADENVESLLSENDEVFLSLSLEPEILEQEILTKQSNISVSNNNFSFSGNISQSEGNSNQERTFFNNKKHGLEDLEEPKQKRRSLDPDPENLFACWKPSDEVDIFNENFEPVMSTSSEKTVSNCKNKMTSVEKPLVVSGEPFVYLKQIIVEKLTKPVVFTVKAIILTLKKKITIVNDEYNLKATITDGSACVDVDFCSEILENFLGYSPCEMATMLKAKNTNSAISQRVKESFSKAQDKLISLNCIIKVKFFNSVDTPLVISVNEVSEFDLKALKERSSCENNIL